MPPAAKRGDKIFAMDVHSVKASPSPIPTAMPFNGVLDNALSPDVTIEGRAAATRGSTATNTPIHFSPTGFVVTPTNQGSVVGGSATVTINGKAAARMGDSALTCTEVPGNGPVVIATSTVAIGD